MTYISGEGEAQIRVVGDCSKVSSAKVVISDVRVAAQSKSHYVALVEVELHLPGFGPLM